MTAIVSKKKSFQSIFIVLLTNDLLFETQNPHYFCFHIIVQIKKKSISHFVKLVRYFIKKVGKKRPL
ncbi:hypothetical protein CJ231_04915 [Hoylesella buccalis]|uniref:Uncharacterized protein n=1 Tax=Hoylesella buccalis TaxID=28127 RepID=A0A2N6QRS9_9BACT|nr:hypothetical protein CJ231_04915 [Hoylesella buccalis]